jgi:hypothetical protein
MGLFFFSSNIFTHVRKNSERLPFFFAVVCFVFFFLHSGTKRYHLTHPFFTIMCTSPEKILIVFGSFVNGPHGDLDPLAHRLSRMDIQSQSATDHEDSLTRTKRLPRDIDVLQRGMSKEEIEFHIERHFGKTGLPIDIHKLPEDGRMNPFGSQFEIPVPGNSRNVNFKVLHYEPANAGWIVGIKRCFGSVSSLLRDETKSVEDKVTFLSEDHHFDWRGIPVNIGEFDGADAGHPFSYSNNYVNGRVSLINAVQHHMGEDNFKLLCDKLWWGKLLYRIYDQKPTERGFEIVQKGSPRAAGQESASFWVTNNPKRIYCTYGVGFEWESAQDEFIKVLYD